MKRSDINCLVAAASACFVEHGWALPPEPRWDVTDFGLGDWRRFGLVLVNLCEELEYCEKLMYVQAGMVTPTHCHAKKKEDIIARWGRLAVKVWKGKPNELSRTTLEIRVNGVERTVCSGDTVSLGPGERVTLMPGVYHEFESETAECIIGEVSTANDDEHDNFFVNPDIGRFPGIEEDEPPVVRLISDRAL